MNRIERSAIVVIILALACYLLYPTYKWNMKVKAEDKSIALESNSYIREQSQSKVREQRSKIELEEDNIDLKSKYLDVVKFCARATGKKASQVWNKQDILSALDNGGTALMEKKLREYYLSLKKLSEKSLKFGLDLRGGLSVLLEADIEATKARLGSEISAEDIANGLNDDVELLRRRVDEFGVSEVDIHRQGTDQIVIEMPGSTDPERVNSLLKNSGSLMFCLVDNEKTNSLASDVDSDRSKYINENDIFISQVYQEGFTAYGVYSQDDLGTDVLVGYAVLDDNQSMDASYIRSVEVGKDQITNQPVVNFTLSSEGGNLFYDLTSKNIGHSLAVLFDGRIKNVATIRSALSTNVQVSGFNAKEAEELSITLKSSALPIDLKVISSQSVGASLGEDSIRQIYKAISLGLIILSVFLIVYYQFAGLMSVALLAINLFLIVAVLSSFGFTLSLTSIAGVILTIGMAADSSIIIFERIREELKKGASVYTSVATAYKKATWTILDANITTMIAALVLSMLGSTAVKGFAITLAIGIVCTLITMLFTSHLIFDLIINTNSNKIFIGYIKKESK